MGVILIQTATMTKTKPISKKFKWASFPDHQVNTEIVCPSVLCPHHQPHSDKIHHTQGLVHYTILPLRCNFSYTHPLASLILILSTGSVIKILTCPLTKHCPFAELRALKGFWFQTVLTFARYLRLWRLPQYPENKVFDPILVKGQQELLQVDTLVVIGLCSNSC